MESIEMVLIGGFNGELQLCCIDIDIVVWLLLMIVPELFVMLKETDLIE